MQYVEVPNQLGNKGIIGEFDEVVKGSRKEFDIPTLQQLNMFKKN